MIAPLVALAVVVVIAWAAKRLIPILGLPEPAPTILYVLVVLLAMVWLAGRLGVLPAWLR